MSRPHINKKLVAEVMEDYFGIGISIKQIAINREISQSAVCKYIDFGFVKRPENNTVTIKLQSKINY